jgi:hypothetical protein
MAAKTSVFYLTESVECATSGTDATDTIDLGSYVDVADRQGILVHEADFIWQGQDQNGDWEVLATTLNGNGNGAIQVTDLNRGKMVFADDRALVASGQMSVDFTNNQQTSAQDLYPDNFGPTSAVGGRIVINDQMYVRANWTGAIDANKAVRCTVRMKVSVIGLSQKDFMAIALQSTAADN